MQTLTPPKRRKIPFWLLKAFKIGVGCSLAVLIADVCGLPSTTFAGIVTLLTIRNTKRDTLAIAGKRMLSFLLSFAAIVVIWGVVEHASLRFMIYMLVLATASCAAKWEDTISVNAVVGGHVLLLNSAITLSFFWSETFLMLIGLCTAIVFNWYMPGVLIEIQEDITYIEAELKSILLRIADELHKKEPIAKEPARVLALRTHIDGAHEKALHHLNNSLTTRAYSHSKYYVEYLAMRHAQCNLLLSCHQSLLDIRLDCPEAVHLAQIMEEIADAVHHKTGIRAIIAELEEIIIQMKTETLPQTTTEFISAAQMFHLLELFEDFLREKRTFLLTLTEHEKQLYWKEEA